MLWSYVENLFWPCIPNVPVLSGYPLLGIFPNMCNEGLFSSVLGKLFDKAEDSGISGAWIGTIPLFYIRDPLIIRQVFVQNAESVTRVGSEGKGPFGILQRTIGDITVTADGQDWRRWRRGLLQEFANPSSLKASYMSVFDMAHQYANKMRQSKGGPDLKNVMENYALDTLWYIVVGATSVSEQSEQLLSPLPPFLDAVGNPSHLWRHIVRNLVAWKPFKHPDAVEMNIRNQINDVVRGLVDQNLMATDFDANDEEPNSKLSFLRRISIESGGTRQQPVTADVMAQALQIYGFGHEASALLLYWGIYELSLRPEVVQKLRNELSNIVSSATELSFNNIQDMKYLDAIFNELLRLHCPISTSARMVTRPIIIQNRDNQPVLLPKGSQAFMSIHMLHHDEQVWGPTVNEFMPERWLGILRNSLENRCQYLPFLSGPRSCPCSNFVALQVKTMLAVLLFDSDVRLPGEEVKKCVGSVVRSTQATRYEVRKLETVWR